VKTVSSQKARHPEKTTILPKYTFGCIDYISSGAGLNS